MHDGSNPAASCQNFADLKPLSTETLSATLSIEVLFNVRACFVGLTTPKRV